MRFLWNMARRAVRTLTAWGMPKRIPIKAFLFNKIGALGVSYGGEYQKQGKRADLWEILGFTMARAYDKETSQ